METLYTETETSLVCDSWFQQARKTPEGVRMDIQGMIVKDTASKPWLAIVIHEGVTNYNLYLSDAEHVDEILGHLIKGLKSAAADLKREASGLIVAQEVPNGYAKGR